MKEIMKNIKKAEVLTLKEEIAYQAGQVVSKTLVQNNALSVTLFSFDKGEEISTHASGGDAFVTCLDGECITTDHVHIRLAEQKLNFFGPDGCSCNATARETAPTAE